MFLKQTPFIFAVLCVSFSQAQISINRNFDLELAEKDSITSLKLETALNGFLTEARDNKYSSNYVDSTHLLRYEFFFNKLAGIGKTANFNNPIVLKSYPVGKGNYRLTVGFTGEREDQPFIFQITELKAVPYQNHYRFYCPFEENTSHFKRKEMGHVTFHYSHEIRIERAQQFADFTADLAELSGGPVPQLNYYAFRDLDELLKSYGFLYSARQCNFLCYDLGFTDNQGKTYMTGTGNENYIFGYIGDYFYYNLPNSDAIYWPFVQGISTYYGGYALSYDDMNTLKAQFRNHLEANPKTDFLVEFKKGRKSSVNRHFSYYVMSAFLFEKALEEQSFKDAIKLVYAGSDGEDFFELLDEVLGVNEANFHQNIVELISEN